MSDYQPPSISVNVTVPGDQYGQPLMQQPPTQGPIYGQPQPQGPVYDQSPPQQQQPPQSPIYGQSPQQGPPQPQPDFSSASSTSTGETFNLSLSGGSTTLAVIKDVRVWAAASNIVHAIVFLSFWFSLHSFSFFQLVSACASVFAVFFGAMIIFQYPKHSTYITEYPLTIQKATLQPLIPTGQQSLRSLCSLILSAYNGLQTFLLIFFFLWIYLIHSYHNVTWTKSYLVTWTCLSALFCILNFLAWGVDRASLGEAQRFIAYAQQHPEHPRHAEAMATLPVINGQQQTIPQVYQQQPQQGYQPQGGYGQQIAQPYYPQQQQPQQYQQTNINALGPQPY